MFIRWFRGFTSIVKNTFSPTFADRGPNPALWVHIKKILLYLHFVLNIIIGHYYNYLTVWKQFIINITKGVIKQGRLRIPLEDCLPPSGQWVQLRSVLLPREPLLPLQVQEVLHPPPRGVRTQGGLSPIQVPTPTKGMLRPVGVVRFLKLISININQCLE